MPATPVCFEEAAGRALLVAATTAPVCFSHIQLTLLVGRVPAFYGALSPSEGKNSPSAKERPELLCQYKVLLAIFPPRIKVYGAARERRARPRLSYVSAAGGFHFPAMKANFVSSRTRLVRWRGSCASCRGC